MIMTVANPKFQQSHLSLANNTDPRRNRLIRTNHLKGLFVLTCCSSGGRGSSASAGFTPHESLFVGQPLKCQREDSS
jgi:hypothetical protein